jgi:hypothetical protein
MTMAWILQGNPKRFDIDDYLTRYHFVYWGTPVNQKEFSIGDRIFIWRSGASAGIVASGYLQELPIKRSNVKIPSALGDDLWIAKPAESLEIKVGIKVDEVRLTPEEGMLEKRTLKVHSLMQKKKIITNPRGTVFRLNAEEYSILDGLWKSVLPTESFDTTYAVSEGKPQLQTHYRRERSRKLIAMKKGRFKNQRGKLFCEICGFSFEDKYPPPLGLDFIEAHHKVPLSQIDEISKTTLDDLILVCSNCHRMIHRTADCDENLRILLLHFSTRS